MIINSTYFINEPLQVPNVSGNPAVTGNTPSLLTQLNTTIQRVEFDIMTNALGSEQYAELKSQMNADGTFIVGALQKWIDLVDGRAADNWLGIRFGETGNKMSFLAYAVYCEILKNQRQTFTTTGLVVPDVANSTVVNPTEEITDKWNTFVTMYQGDCSYQYLNYWNPIFFEWNGYPYSEAVNNMVSLKKFMADNPDDYSSDYFKTYDFKNRFGL